MKQGRDVFYGVFIVLALLPLLFYTDLFAEPKPADPQAVSLVIRGQNNSSWDTIRRGAELACEERNLILNYIELSADNDEQEQADVLRRELEGGTGAVVLAAVGSEILTDLPAALLQATPVVFVESAAGEVPAPLVSPDNAAMGRDIAAFALAKTQPPARVLLLGNGQSSAIQERRMGVEEVLAAARVDFSYRDIQDILEDDELFYAQLGREGIGAVIALDTGTLESVGWLFESQRSAPALYGIGSSVRIVYFIENDVVDAVIAYNDFALGYLAVLGAADALDGKKAAVSQSIPYELVTLDNVFDPDKQQLIFEVR